MRILTNQVQVCAGACSREEVASSDGGKEAPPAATAAHTERCTNKSASVASSARPTDARSKVLDSGNLLAADSIGR